MSLWWDTHRIKLTVNQAFVERSLVSQQHISLLQTTPAFGQGLTNDTYLEFILERTPRLFLILCEIGVPLRIFHIIDRSFDDADLPLSKEALWELNLFETNSTQLDNRFYDRQFAFLVIELEAGCHIDYEKRDVVPVDVTYKRRGIASSSTDSERVSSGQAQFCRKRMVTRGETHEERMRFISLLKTLSSLQHCHLVTTWASYSHLGINYVLITPACEVTLKHILDEKETAKCFKALDKEARRAQLMTWLRCLSTALTFLHARGFVHRAIRPSTISIGPDLQIYLRDYDAIQALDSAQSTNAYKGEVYEYAPPENWQRKACLHESTPLKTILPGGGRTSRRAPRSDRPVNSSHQSPPIRDFSRQDTTSSQHSSSGSTASTNLRPRAALITTFTPPAGNADSRSDPSEYFASDVFSMTAVLLSILSYILGHSPASFAAFRGRLNRQAGRGNGPPDTSFHKNPKQISRWIDRLIEQAGKKEKKNLHFWGSVVEMSKLCRSGLHLWPEDRLSMAALDQKISSWVDWGIGEQRRCACLPLPADVEGADTTSVLSHSSAAILTAQTDSPLSWTKINERMIADGTMRVQPPRQVIRPSRTPSQRLLEDRAPQVRRDRLTRPSSPQSMLPVDDENNIMLASTLDRRHSTMILASIQSPRILGPPSPLPRADSSPGPLQSSHDFPIQARMQSSQCETLRPHTFNRSRAALRLSSNSPSPSLQSFPSPPSTSQIQPAHLTGAISPPPSSYDTSATRSKRTTATTATTAESSRCDYFSAENTISKLSSSHKGSSPAISETQMPGYAWSCLSESPRRIHGTDNFYIDDDSDAETDVCAGAKNATRNDFYDKEGACAHEFDYDENETHRDQEVDKPSIQMPAPCDLLVHHAGPDKVRLNWPLPVAT